LQSGSSKPGLILLDMKTPVMDGYQTTTLIKANTKWKDIPVIVLTATILKEDREKMKQCGCDGYLAKPIDENQLFSELMKYLPYEREEPSPAKPGQTIEKEEPENDFNDLKPEEISEIKVVLAGGLMNKWRQLEGSMFLDQWAAFGQEVIQLGEKFAARTLVNYGRHLLDNVNDLNILELKKTIQAYPQLLRALKNQKITNGDNP